MAIVKSVKNLIFITLNHKDDGNKKSNKI